jgi:phosphate transporter
VGVPQLLPSCSAKNVHSYDALKKYIYQLEKQQHGREASSPLYHDIEVGEQSQLLDDRAAVSDTDALFIPLLDRELQKITAFYTAQEKEIMDELNSLEADVAEQEAVGLDGADGYLQASDDDDDDDESVQLSQSPDRRRRTLSHSAGAGKRLPGAHCSPLMSGTSV